MSKPLVVFTMEIEGANWGASEVYCQPEDAVNCVQKAVEEGIKHHYEERARVERWRGVLFDAGPGRRDWSGEIAAIKGRD